MRDDMFFRLTDVEAPAVIKRIVLPKPKQSLALVAESEGPLLLRRAEKSARSIRL